MGYGVLICVAAIILQAQEPAAKGAAKAAMTRNRRPR